MITAISIDLLQHYWWFLISLLGGILVFLLFVQGGQTLIYSLGKTENERTMLVNSLGRKWEFTFTTLVTFGGAVFASFPLFYSTSFGGAYWVWIAILLCFVIQAVAYEFRSKPNNLLGAGTYETFLFINGTLGTFLLGVAVATLFTGANFTVNLDQLISNNVLSITRRVPNDYAITRWNSSAHGLEALLDIRNIILGLAVLFLARVQGILYFMNTIDHPAIYSKAKKQLLYNAIPFVLFFVVFLLILVLKSGYTFIPDTHQVTIEPYKYLHNLIQMPVTLVLLLVGVILVLYGIFISLMKETSSGIWFSGTGTILTVTMLFLITAYNNTAYYFSYSDIQSTLTLQNSSSSYYTLKVMSYVSLFIPVVLAYIIYSWRSINNKKIDENELKEDTHLY